ncbi:cytochrome c oxidase [Dinoroseobacter shibae DFL 12 = DSM 16493]|jgi:cytochrome c oxidase cbb3-type subunit 4|uniref:Cytochrome c oxidase n=1 Tax=Dinoroseobacter shibae (strain DSM 16493 / NCIMB 14021 / DFL 12) TaxID=398580 RepID=A8LQC3_DINSH|nr:MULTISPECIES: cbb3-type cytochrome c oxidase subunit 3 [Dinoroseobacter]ABV92409.1 cytochrome c oxidase [Dinoroseobacter shibae DFL 12 = DSM 16493]MDD9718335.1 cbb3-type cytochrome c oxidase subunit 3 [Dinoroseobacter sp. PD6]URF47355.1 cbb3-type cytochrome c oxidase subunit 3 [Dinoroseobacter shibae]URF51666.1 cbb3-type cytochrome c oxidase subunit 3 [Dinoroseobacter shibae]
MEETVTILQQVKDNFTLVFLFSVFVGVVLWALRPGSKATHKDVANIPFRHEDKPATDRPSGLPEVSERIAQFKEARL